MIGKTDDGHKLPVNVDTHGRVVISGTVSSIGNVETILNTQTGIMTSEAADIATIKGNSSKVPGFSLPAYDYIACSYTGSNLTGVVYKSGGASGATVATLTLGYSGSNLVSVTKS